MASTLQTRSSRARLGTFGGPRWQRWWYLLPPSVVPLVVFLPRITGGGFTSDDWSNRSAGLFTSASTLWDKVEHDPISHRALHPLYAQYYDTVFGSHQRAYLVWTLLTACVMGALIATLLVRVHLPAWFAAAVGTLGVIFPYASVTKIWLTAHIGHIGVGLAAAGILVALRGLTRPTTPSRVLHHAAALLLFLISLDLYEIALPLICCSGLFYVAARWPDLEHRRRAATYRPFAVRWALDLIVVAVWYASIRGDTVIGEETTSTVDRLRLIGGDGAQTLLGSFVPFLAQSHRPDGATIYSGAWFSQSVALCVLVGLVATAALLVAGGRRLLPTASFGGLSLRAWGAAILVAIAAGFLGWLAIVPANDYYRPVPTDSAALRVNVLAAFGLAAAVVAVVGALAAAVRGLTDERHRSPRIAVAVAAIGLLVVTATYLRHIRSEIELWNTASTEQVHVLGTVRTALGDHPAHGTVVVLTDQPEYVADGAEVFFSSWSFNGAVQSTFRDPTLQGIQHRTTAQYGCTPKGLAPYFVQYRLGGDAVVPYRNVALVSTARSRAWRMSDARSCTRTLRAAGLVLAPTQGAPALGTT